MLPLFFVIGVIFEVLGGVLLSYSNQVNEYVHDYTDCPDSGGIACKTYNYSQTCSCAINFQLSADYVVNKLFTKKNIYIQNIELERLFQ